MRIVGYADRLAAHPGDEIRFQVSCAAAHYDVAIERLWHGDLNPAGPGFKADVVPSPVNRSYPGRRQPLHPGSYVRIPDGGVLAGLQRFTLCCWAFPTLVGGEPRALLTRWSEATAAGYGLFVGGESDLVVRLGAGRGDPPVVLRSGAALALRRWYFLACTVDLPAGVARLYQIPREHWPDDPSRAAVEREFSALALGTAPAFLIAAANRDSSDGRDAATGFFNGKIDRPAVFSRILSEAEIAGLASGHPAWDVAGAVAAWDFAADIGGSRVTDRSGGGLHGHAVNMPTRGVTGWNWTGDEDRFSVSAAGHGAIHFHDDDLEDAGWQTDFALAIPDDWPSGIYAARLTAGDVEDHVPFVVRPPRRAAGAPIAFLVPTLTYLAYANEHLATAPGGLLDALGLSLDAFLANEATPYEQGLYRYAVEQRLHSLYDRHADGSGVCYASRLRPLVNIRPRFNKSTLRFRHPHLLSCDLYIADWMAARGFRHDCIDDEQLHEEGAALLARYAVIVTGSHPEYWTAAMLAALRAYLAGGGRLLYLGGNGFYWVTTVDPQRPHAIEVRRGVAGVRTWSSEPGELHHSTTGELGGLWRFRGHPPQSIVGVGFSAYSGLAPARPYRRTPASHDPSLAFIFEGVEAEVVGDVGLHLGGAAGWEIDSADAGLGTPAHAVVLASSFDHPAAMLPVIEAFEGLPAAQGAGPGFAAHADLTYVAGPAGGAVFSVGSMSWSGCLPFNGYRNDISRITENVLRAFCASRPDDGR